MKNKIGIHYGSFVNSWLDDQLPLVKKAKSLGFDLLEFGAVYLTSLKDDKIKAFAEEAKAQKVTLALSLGLTAKEDPSSPDASVRKVGLNLLKSIASAMKKAEISDCSGIVYGAWNGKIGSDKDRPGYWDRSVASMKEAAKVFEDNGIYFNVEVVNRFESFLINDCATALQYVEAVGSKNLGIHLDTFHMNIEEDSMVNAITAAGKRLRYFHIGENNRKFPGLGSMPWKNVFDALKAAKYAGPITMEPFVRTGGEVATSVSLFRPIMDLSTYDQDLMNSVAFVKGLMK